ncbi:uncharacterized protein EKO05_0005868 [Ascochyta rabiei]|uniref:Uncharacterized protein n=1 Tax=Didymella rabiei TaxID=5454 RepID=A0A163IYR3_DIDRA|nr:uncharacterized protein EKO05_0005868 [Ascochyta rabiei]KZM26032.1 hypothetical protein ST47_g2809 [Ascochyta rabiei]UPX15421.1 hypothetical protein EKO05_0005868 [Ascochyta rabiei]
MISLSLAKLSTAQDAYPDEQNFQWRHETNNLICVVDSYQIGGSALQLLKIVQGTQVREHIELERLIVEGRELIRGMQERGIELKGDQLPISAIVRCPLLAIRWQLPNKQVRRLQIRFQTNEDFDQVYSHLHQLGLRMSPPQSQSKDRGSTAGSGTSARLAPSPTRPTAQSTGPSCPPSRLTEITNRPYTAVSAPTAIESQIQEAAHTRPASAFSSASFAPTNPLTPPMYFPRPDSASVSSSDYPTSFSPQNRPIATIEQHDVFASRPETALLYDRPDTAELPPRRELPFRRDSLPTSSGNDSNRPQSRPSTGLMGPPPMPNRVSDLRPGSARNAAFDSDLPPLRLPTIVPDIAKTSPVHQRPLTPLPPARSPPKPAQTTTTYEEQQPLPSASSSPHAYPTPTSTSPVAARPLSAASSASQNQREPASPSAFTSSPARGSKDRSDRAHAPVRSDDTENALRAYAMQSDDKRTAALNSFIFKSLDDNNFVTLVEDMEMNWARLGLGTW